MLYTSAFRPHIVLHGTRIIAASSQDLVCQRRVAYS
jgi:hypothetical protein